MKKLTALILALVMLLTLAACAAKPAATEPEQPEQTPAAEETTQTEQTEQAPAEETAAGTQTPVTGNVITDEDVSLTIWMIGDREEHFNTAIEAYTAVHPNVSIDISYFDTSTLKSNCMAAAGRRGASLRQAAAGAARRPARVYPAERRGISSSRAHGARAAL